MVPVSLAYCCLFGVVTSKAVGRVQSQRSNPTTARPLPVQCSAFRVMRAPKEKGDSARDCALASLVLKDLLLLFKNNSVMALFFNDPSTSDLFVPLNRFGQPQVNVGKAPSSGRMYDTASKFDEVGVMVDGQRSVSRTLGVSLLGACSSKGCPEKSVENEDRYVHVSFFSQLAPGAIIGDRK